MSATNWHTNNSETILLYQEKNSIIWFTFFIEAEYIHMSPHMTFWLKVKFYSSFIHNVYLCSAVNLHKVHKIKNTNKKMMKELNPLQNVILLLS